MLLGNMHDYGALGDVLPWPLALLGCTIVLRTVTFPLHVKQQQMGFNMQVAKPLHDALQKKMQKDIESGVPMADAQVRPSTYMGTPTVRDALRRASQCSVNHCD